MSFHLRHPAKRSRLAIHRHHVRAFVNLIGTLNVPDNHLVAVHRGADARDRSLNAVVIGDLVRPDQPAALFLDCEKTSTPIGKVNRVSVHRRRSGNIGARREHPFCVSRLTLEGLIVCSAGWLQLLLRFCPAIRHSPGGASSDWPRAPSAENRKTPSINAAFDNDALRFLARICILLLAFGFVTTCARVPWKALEQSSALFRCRISIHFRE